MKIKIMSLLGAIAMFLGIGIVGAPAHATDSAWQEGHCQTFQINDEGTQPLSICVRLGYRMQDDGSGLRNEDFDFDVVDGCNFLESDGGGKANAPTDMLTATRDTHATVATLNFNGFYSCHVYRDIEINGPETGGEYVVIRVKARIDTEIDHLFTFRFNACSFNNC